MSVEEYLEMGVLGLIAWTQRLQDPSYREERESQDSISMELGKIKYWSLAD